MAKHCITCKCDELPDACQCGHPVSEHGPDGCEHERDDETTGNAPMAVRCNCKVTSDGPNTVL